MIKRTLILIGIVSLVVAGFLATRGQLPFLPIYGVSMEPLLQAGDLITIEKTPTEDIKVGDVIVFNVPSLTRQMYNYPAVVAHRVVEKRVTASGVSFRTRGDNTAGEDPFTVRPQDVKGTVAQRIPYAGFPFLFFQSSQGLIFVITVLSLLTLYFYSEELGKGRQFVHRRLLSPVIVETQRSSREIAEKLAGNERAMTETQKALASFSEAIAEYATHLKSHTSAIQGLSEASHELKRGAAEQNSVLASLARSLTERPPAGPGEPRVQRIIVREKGQTLAEHTARPETEQVVVEVQVTPQVQVGTGPAPQAMPVTGTIQLPPEPDEGERPPGCYQNRRDSSRRLTLAEKQRRLLEKRAAAHKPGTTLPRPHIRLATLAPEKVLARRPDSRQKAAAAILAAVPRYKRPE